MAASQGQSNAKVSSPHLREENEYVIINICLPLPLGCARIYRWFSLGDVILEGTFVLFNLLHLPPTFSLFEFVEKRVKLLAVEWYHLYQCLLSCSIH